MKVYSNLCNIQCLNVVYTHIDMERELLSMRQQLAEKEKQVQELEMKLQTKQEKEHIHILPTGIAQLIAVIIDLIMYTI